MNQTLSDSDQKVDLLLNVFGKPYQTALSVLSLLRYCGSNIDKIWFHEEPCTSEFERKDSRVLLEYLGDRVRHFFVPQWLSSEVTDEARLLEDEAYRLSMRYQYGWENTDKKFALFIHNDIEVTGDILSEFLREIGEYTAIGEIGQCWWCPAGQKGLCDSERYAEYRPSYEELMRIYNDGMDYTQRRAYNLGLRQEMREQPWPLPECRVNEWAMLVNLEKARPATQPLGKAAPIGARYASGAQIGENWDEDVTLDTGVQWFRDLCLQGHKFADFPVERYIIHDRRGKVALSYAELYVKNEIMAKKRLAEEYPDFLTLMEGRNKG